MVRKSDTLARLGGDEFGVILECGSPEERAGDAAILLANRIIDRVRASRSVSAIGTSRSAPASGSPLPGGRDPIRRRCSAPPTWRCIAPRKTAAARICFFQQSMEVELRARAALEEDVRQAVASEEIQPHYQPLMKLAENRLVGFEILARWHHPVRGDVPPDTFIPVVEKLGLIGELTYSLLRRACLDARDWSPEITIALNVSPKHFGDPLLPVKLLAILSETGFPADAA